MEDNVILFDRNNNKDDNRLVNVAIQNQINDLRQKIIDNSLETYERKQYAIDILDIYDRHNTTDIQVLSEIISKDPNSVKKYMLQIGVISGHLLEINIPPVSLRIDLAIAIETAIMYRCNRIFSKMIKLDIAPDAIRHDILFLCIKYNNDKLLIKLLHNNYGLNDNSWIQKIVTSDNLKIAKYIHKNINLSDFVENISKLSILHKKYNFIDYFVKDNFCYYLDYCVQNDCDIDMFQYFYYKGIDTNIALQTAKKYNNQKLIQFIEDILLESSHIDIINNYIGTTTYCHVSHDTILENDNYFKCDNGHYFSKNNWGEILKIRYHWTCPRCLSNVEKLIYCNTKN